MRSHVAFDTLAYSNKLKEAGMDAKIAEVQTEMNAQIISNILEEQSVTKKDLHDVRQDNQNDISSLKLELHETEKRLIDKISESSWRLIFVLGSIQAIVLGVLGFFKHV